MNKAKSVLPVCAQKNAARQRRALLVALAALLLLPATAHADNLIVDCDADPNTLPPGTYPTINAALSVLASTGIHAITITGTCVENVSLGGFENITLAAPTGATATIMHPLTPTRGTIMVISRSLVTLARLVIREGDPGLDVRNSAQASLIDVTVENNQGEGLHVELNSAVQFRGSFVSRQNATSGVTVRTGGVLVSRGPVTIQDNGGNGLFVTGNSTVNFNGPVTVQGSGGNGFSVGGLSLVTMGRDDGTAPVRISGNAGNGINITGGAVVSISGDTIIENHPNGVGINVGSSVVTLFAAASQNIVRNNVFGISAADRSDVALTGNNLIQNNTQLGVQVAGVSVARFSQAGLPGGGVVGSVIEGNSALGLNMGSESHVFFFGPHKVRNNGAAPPPSLAGVQSGIRMVGGTLALRRDVEISGNFGPGISAEFNGSIVVGSPTEPPSNVMITGNSEEGIRLLRTSQAWFANAGMVSGNGVAAITCDKSSWLFGDTTGIANIKCNNTDKNKP